MGIVVDTNVFIDVEMGRFDMAHLARIKKQEEVYIAAITASELLAGVHLASSAEQRIKRMAFVESVIGSVPIIAFDEEVARVYAGIYAHFVRPRSKKAGNVHDLQIAATAIAYGYSVLTSNTVDFKKIPGIKLV